MQPIDELLQLIAIGHRLIHGIRYGSFELPCRHTDEWIELLDQCPNQIIPIHNLFADFTLLHRSFKLSETLRTAMLHKPIAKTAPKARRRKEKFAVADRRNGADEFFRIGPMGGRPKPTDPCRCLRDFGYLCIPVVSGEEIYRSLERNDGSLHEVCSEC